MTSQSSCSPAHPIADDAALRRRMIALARRWLGLCLLPLGSDTLAEPAALA